MNLVDLTIDDDKDIDPEPPKKKMKIEEVKSENQGNVDLQLTLAKDIKIELQTVLDFLNEAPSSTNLIHINQNQRVSDENESSLISLIKNALYILSQKFLGYLYYFDNNCSKETKSHIAFVNGMAPIFLNILDYYSSFHNFDQTKMNIIKTKIKDNKIEIGMGLWSELNADAETIHKKLISSMKGEKLSLALFADIMSSSGDCSWQQNKPYYPKLNSFLNQLFRINDNLSMNNSIFYCIVSSLKMLCSIRVYENNETNVFNIIVSILCICCVNQTYKIGFDNICQSKTNVQALIKLSSSVIYKLFGSYLLPSNIMTSIEIQSSLQSLSNSWSNIINNDHLQSITKICIKSAINSNDTQRIRSSIATIIYMTGSTVLKGITSKDKSQFPIIDCVFGGHFLIKKPLYNYLIRSNNINNSSIDPALSEPSLAAVNQLVGGQIPLVHGEIPFHVFDDNHNKNEDFQMRNIIDSSNNNQQAQPRTFDHRFKGCLILKLFEAKNKSVIIYSNKRGIVLDENEQIMVEFLLQSKSKGCHYYRFKVKANQNLQEIEQVLLNDSSSSHSHSQFHQTLKTISNFCSPKYCIGVCQNHNGSGSNQNRKLLNKDQSLYKIFRKRGQIIKFKVLCDNQSHRKDLAFCINITF